MWRTKRFLWVAALAGATLLVGGVSVVTSQEQALNRPPGQVKVAAPPRLDRAKNDVIEQPVRTIVNQTAALPTPPPPQPLRRPGARDFTKRVIVERPLETVVVNTSAPPRTPAPASADGFVNPKVQPGKVRWHATLAAAQAAASKSKKPILLFQMMGKLDDQFC